ncbi:hypothetical protein MKY37_12165 [Psychrobacillus sp. FSL K6-2836]|uniref:hypothetical protein n=1 Tax=Psychrobacillus sp. FSL K6-2836 TaxID=2921548 RepID=UPI0030F95592
MNEIEQKELVESIKEISISAAQVIASEYASREYRIDLGLNAETKPIIFNTHGISGFANPRWQIHLEKNCRN